MAEKRPPYVSHPETKIAVFDGMQPTPEENLVEIEKLAKQIIDRKPRSIVIYAEFSEGVVAGAVGSYITLASLMRVGKLQIEDMMSRSQQAGENG